MLVESLVKATVEWQGFRVRRVTGDVTGLAAELTPDWRYAPRCGRCERRGRYRDTRWVRHFRHVPLWGIPVTLVYAPRRVACGQLWHGACRGAALGGRPAAVHPSLAGHDRDVDATCCRGSRSPGCSGVPATSPRLE